MCVCSVSACLFGDRFRTERIHFSSIYSERSGNFSIRLMEGALQQRSCVCLCVCHDFWCAQRIRSIYALRLTHRQTTGRTKCRSMRYEVRNFLPRTGYRRGHGGWRGGWLRRRWELGTERRMGRSNRRTWTFIFNKSNQFYRLCVLSFVINFPTTTTKKYSFFFFLYAQRLCKCVQKKEKKCLQLETQPPVLESACARFDAIGLTKSLPEDIGCELGRTDWERMVWEREKRNISSIYVY